MEALPTFRYHPDPLATGSIAASSTTCRCCHRARGYIYCLTPYGKERLPASLCPWCIADGTAHERFDVEFTDPASIGGNIWPEAADAIIATVAHRTPGFAGWQQERWAVCCGDAAAYLGAAGHDDIVTRYPDAIPDLQRDMEMSDNDWPSFLAELDANGSPVAHIFRCLHCGRHTGYCDLD